MHTELQALFDEHAAPQHCCKRDVHDQLGPFVDLAARAQMQVMVYRRMLTTARVTPHDPILDMKLQNIKATIAAMDQNAANLVTAIEQVAHDWEQAERYFSEWKGEVARMEAIKEQGDAARVAPSVP